MTKKQPPPQAPHSFEYEFGGPVGTLANTLLLPVVTLLLLHWSEVGSVDFTFGKTFYSSLQTTSFWDSVGESAVLCPGCQNDATILYKCSATLVGYFLFQVILERCLPGEVVLGAPVQGDANLRLSYRMNGHLAYWVTLLTVQCGYPIWHEASGYWQLTSFPLELVHEYMAELALAAILFCFALSLYLYVDSFNGTRILANGGNSGNCFYDFWMGRELNPRIFSFDWKVFCELRPGLIGWMLLNLACLKQQYLNLGYITGSMMLINIFQGIYVWDALFQERAILTTMDVTTDGLGFMLVFGDLAWVPFTYSLQARYLVHHDPHLSYSTLAMILALHILGYYIFRSANGEKDAFRRNPNDPKLAHLQFLQTKRGTKLLTTGWWGMARKINYTGDWIMGLTWCLVCGVDSIVPYFYAIYFAILLVHRSIRDDQMCQAKYGEDWKTYKELVPYRFVPGLF